MDPMPFSCTPAQYGGARPVASAPMKLPDIADDVGVIGKRMLT